MTMLLLVAEQGQGTNAAYQLMSGPHSCGVLILPFPAIVEGMLKHAVKHTPIMNTQVDFSGNLTPCSVPRQVNVLP